MRGHEALIAMRVRGSVPDCVWIDLEPDRLERWRDWQVMDNSQAHLSIDATERRPDLRVVKGLRCYVLGDSLERVRFIRDQCIENSAKRVIAAVTRQGERGEWVLHRMSDTEGVFLA